MKKKKSADKNSTFQLFGMHTQNQHIKLTSINKTNWKKQIKLKIKPDLINCLSRSKNHNKSKGRERENRNNITCQRYLKTNYFDLARFDFLNFCKDIRERSIWCELWVIYLLIGQRRDRCRGQEAEMMKIEGERKKAGLV